MPCFAILCHAWMCDGVGGVANRGQMERSSVIVALLPARGSASHSKSPIASAGRISMMRPSSLAGDMVYE